MTINDTFNRADNATALGTTSDGSATWSALRGTWGISSNQAYRPTSGSVDLAVLDTGAADGTVQVTMAAVGVGGSGGLTWRAVDTSNYFLWETNGELFDVASGSFNRLDAANDSARACGAGDVMAVRLTGTTTEFLKNGSVVSTLTLSSRTSATKHGLMDASGVSGDAIRWDDFSWTPGAATVAVSGDVKSEQTLAGTLTLLTIVSVSGSITADYTLSGVLAAGGLRATVNAETVLGATLSVSVPISAWVGDDIERMDLPFELEGILDVEPVEVPPPSTDPYIQRVSITMPTPTLVNGRPDATWTPTVARSDWGRLQLIVGSVDLSRPRGIGFLALNDAHTDPFGDAEAAFALPGLTEFDDPAAWGLIALAPVKLRRKDPGGVFHTIYEGALASLEQYTLPGGGDCVAIQCVGALYRLDLLKEPPRLLTSAQDYGDMIAVAFNDKRRRYFTNTGVMRHVATGVPGVRNADFQPFLTGTMQDYLAELQTQGAEYTIMLSRPRTPVLTTRDTTTVHATVSYGAQGVDVKLSKDFTTGTTAVYGTGTNGHCFPADTSVLPFGTVERGYRRAYSGAMVKITTAGGAELSGTPNHPVMTGRGWVPLGEVKEGDHLVSDPRSQGVIADGPDVQDMPTAIGEVFKALTQTGLCERASAVDMPFHGDWSDGEVEVVTADGQLLDGLKAEPTEERLQRFLVGAGDSEPLLANLRLQLEEIFASRVSSESSVGGSRVSPPLIGGQRGEMKPGSLPGSASGHPEALESVADAECGHAEGTSEARDRLAAEIAANEIVVVDVIPDWAGHVYNLQTSSGVYSANGFLVANCTWMGARFPNLHQLSAPAFPLAVGHTFVAGDGQTGFAPFAAYLRTGQYGTIESDDTYLTSDFDSVEQFQDRAGITVDGIVGAQTWTAAFQPGANQGSLYGAYVDTIYEKGATRRRLYNAQGADVGSNPAFDPTVPRIEDYIPFGDNVSKKLGRTSAKQTIARNYPAGRVGTITLTSDPTEMSRYDLAAGMNLNVTNYAGGTILVHIIRRVRDWQNGTVTLTVDEKHRDLLTAASIHQRNKDVSDLTRRQRFGRQKSKVFDDYGAWLCEDGAGHIPLMNQQGGFWNIQRIAAAPKGSIERISLALGTGLTQHLVNQAVSSTPPSSIPGAARGCIALFSQPVTANSLSGLPGLGTPLTSLADGTNPWDHNNTTLVNNYGMIYAAGGPGNALGFYPNNDPGDGSDTHLTGLFEDGGSIQFGPTGHYWLWVAIWCPTSCLVGGQIFPGPPS